MPCFVANCAVVNSPRSASSATFALNSAEYRFRLLVIQVRLSQKRTELSLLSEFRGPPQTVEPPSSVRSHTMASFKPVVNLHPAYRDDIGDLMTRRPIPAPGLDHLGAFLFLNHHGPQTYAPGNDGLPFGPHPHRGFETVTFILDGKLAHRDSAGHESIINAGGVQWMTAGSGLVHSEVSPESFREAGGPLELLQLWVNLPARLKMTAPRYIGRQQS